MNNKQLKNMLEIFLMMQSTKELPRQGFIYEGFKRNDVDSVASHSYLVSVFSYLLARELRKEGVDIDPDKTLKIALFHDAGETITGDIGTMAKELARSTFNHIEKKAFTILMRNVSDLDEVQLYLDEYQALETLESQLVKVCDLLDALLQAQSNGSVNTTSLKKNIFYMSRTKIKNKYLRDLLSKAIYLISDRMLLEIFL